VQVPEGTLTVSPSAAASIAACTSAGAQLLAAIGLPDPPVPPLPIAPPLPPPPAPPPAEPSFFVALLAPSSQPAAPTTRPAAHAIHSANRSETNPRIFMKVLHSNAISWAPDHDRPPDGNHTRIGPTAATVTGGFDAAVLGRAVVGARIRRLAPVTGSGAWQRRCHRESSAHRVSASEPFVPPSVTEPSARLSSSRAGSRERRSKSRRGGHHRGERPSLRRTGPCPACAGPGRACGEDDLRRCPSRRGRRC
jgi:hypothetical protein